MGYENGMPFLVFLALCFALVLAVLWFLLPFAVFGIKERLDKIIKLLEAAGNKEKD